MNYILDSDAWFAYVEGYNNGTITDSETDLIKIILDQEIVSYCSRFASYTFDYNDLVEE